MKMIRFLCLLLVIFSSLGMAGMFMKEPIVPIAELIMGRYLCFLLELW
jgi:hypothetical protein